MSEQSKSSTTCTHNNVYDEQIRGNGSQILEDTICSQCKKVLRRKYFTDQTDPKDDIADLTWFINYYKNKHGKEPDQNHYDIVTKIER